MDIIFNKYNVSKCIIQNVEVYFLGYFSYQDVLYCKNEACGLIASFGIENRDLVDSISSHISEMNGSFAFVIKRGNYLLGAVDRLRSYPLYYNEARGISDSVLQQADSNEEVDRKACIEILSAGYTVGDRTIYSMWKSLLPGQIVCFSFNQEVSVISYFRHTHHICSELTKEEIQNKVSVISQRVIERTVKSLNGKKILLPLSGGYDSRYIACMLKDYGYSDIVAYTYGSPDSYEVNSSREIAKKLGLKWCFIEYSKELYTELIEKQVFDSFFEFSFTGNGIPCIQELPALYRIKEEYDPNEFCILPGYCGDLFGGSYLFPSAKQNYSIEELTDYLYDKHFNFRKNTRIEKKMIVDDLSTCMKNPPQSFSYAEAARINEEWFVSHKVTKFVVNALRMHEFYGYKWRIPLWDNELMDLWYSVPLKYRGLEENLYRELLFKTYFDKYGLSEFQKPASFYKKPSTGMILGLKNAIKELNGFISMNYDIHLVRRIDINNYQMLSKHFFDKLADKKRICFRNAGINAFIARQVLEGYRYET